ncbi:MAG: dTMP kinase [Pirellulales bacterium]
MSGCFFCFDGLDGSGKSTQMELFGEWLAETGVPYITCRDPGSTPLGEKLRDLLLNHHELSISMISEMLLYQAARAQLVEEVIRPALTAGTTVVSDRFLLANVVYQGHAGGLSVADIWHVGQLATGGLLPDLTFLFDLDATAARNRLSGPADRLESRGLDYWQRVRDGYLAEAQGRNDVVVVDAQQTVEAIQAELRRLAAPRIERQ